MLKLETRQTPATHMQWASPLLALLLTVVLGALLFMLLGKPPIKALSMFFYEPIKSLYGLSELTVKAAPLILCALGLAMCYRANVWNIGAEGQLLMGAVAAGGVAILAPADAPRAYFILVLLAGIVGGMAWAGLTAWLRDTFNTNEILVSLMLTYVAYNILVYLVFGPWRDPNGYNFPQSKVFEDAAMLPKLIKGTRIHWGFVLSLLAAGAAYVFMFRSYAGYQMQVGGLSPLAARYAGYSSRKALWGSLLTCGALAGLAGACEVAGPIGQLHASVSPGYGFAAIIVAFVGRLHPITIILSATLMSMFYIGGELAQSRLGMPSAITGVFQGMLLFSLLACDTFIHQKIVWKKAAKNTLPTLTATKGA
jgi:general nucleoside transport system permease protein